MKKFFDSLKDFLYDSTDYIIMTLIVVSVISVIGWRLDILFAKDNSDALDIVHIEEDIKIDKDSNDYAENIDVEDTDTDLDSNHPSIDNDLNSDNQVFIINISIPEGSLPATIGELLESKGLVENKKAFIDRAQELNLDRKLRSGDYSFNSDDTLDNIIKKIANVN